MELNNIEDSINSILFQINAFNNGEDEYVEAVEEVMIAVKTYTKTAKVSYFKFRLLELYLDLSLLFVNNAIRKNEQYQELHGYYQSDLDFYLESVNKLKRYINKCEKTGDVDHLDSAYLLTIYLSNILSNLSDYMKEISNITGKLANRFDYFGSPSKVRERTSLDIEEIKKLMKNIEEEI